MSQSAEQSVQTAASSPPSQANVKDSGEVQAVTVAASHLGVATDAADRGVQTDNTQDAIEQLRLETAKGMNDLRQETTKGMNDLRHETTKEINDMRQENVKGICDLRQETTKGIRDLRQETVKGISDLRQETTNELDEAIRELRQEMMDMFSATLPKSSDGNDNVPSLSRSPGSSAADPTRPEGESLPEITPDLADTGIIGIVDALVTFKRCFLIS